MYILTAQTYNKKLSLICVQCTVYTYTKPDMYAAFRSLCSFKMRGPMKINGPGDLASRIVSVAVPSEFFIQNSFKTTGWGGPVSQTTNAKT